tara:strand:+ start:56 stop:298 length:243 start_codon:yes stop_codon:yes gene_type:complete
MKTFTRKEYNLVHNALQKYELYMSDEEKRTSQIIQDKLYYFNADKIVDSEDDVFDEIVADAEEALANEPEINGVRSLNFR